MTCNLSPPSPALKLRAGLGRSRSGEFVRVDRRDGIAFFIAVSQADVPDNS